MKEMCKKNQLQLEPFAISKVSIVARLEGKQPPRKEQLNSILLRSFGPKTLPWVVAPNPITGLVEGEGVNTSSSLDYRRPFWKNASNTC